MHLTPQELDKLSLHQAGALAQKRLARGVRLNYPEAVALIATQLLELIRDGRRVSELMDLGKRFLGVRNVMDGVPSMIADVQVEGTFPDGSKLVTVHHPIVAEYGDLALALYGSFLPVPANERFAIASLSNVPVLAEPPPGEYEVLPGSLTLNAGRRTLTLQVTNTGDRAVQVGSHYPFIETNRALVFDRVATLGMRLDIPAGTAVRFEPGEAKTINLVEVAGNKIIRGGNSLVDGPANDPARVRERVTRLGFGDRQP
jgi:urease subunit gamma/beta